MSRKWGQTPIILLLLASLGGCGGSDGDGPTGTVDQQDNQTASASATPAAAIISRGSTTNVTVVFTTTGGLKINSFTISRQYTGISVNQVSSQTSGSTITRVYAIGADNSVPVGSHNVKFVASIDGYTGTGVPPTPNVTFILTVTE